MKMNKTALASAAIVAGVFSAGSALAQDSDLKVTLGLKVWQNNWSTWFNTATAVNQRESGFETAVIPSLTLRKNNLFLSGDMFQRNSYSFGAVNPNVKRDEWSIVGGYYIVPQLAIAGGFKRVHQNFGTGFNMNLDVPVIGAQGGAGIGTGNWFIYGNGYVGPMKANTVAGGATSSKGWYYSTELGVGYAITRQLAATGGFKSQTIRWDNVVANIPGNDVTTGFIGGLAYTF